MRETSGNSAALRVACLHTKNALIGVMSKISIIMGIYNCAGTLSEALESILAQTYTDWEVIMCDDASADDTAEIAQRYVERYPGKFKLLKNEENLKLGKTLNRCLEAATGEYIARMDGDDISLPGRLETEAGFLDEHPEYAIVSSAMIFFDENGDWGCSKQIEAPQIKDLIFRSPVHFHAPCMIRSRAYMQIGGYSTDKRTERVEDCDLWYRLYAEGYRGYNLRETLYKARDDRNAESRRTLRSRLNGVYVSYIGYKRLNVPIRYYFLLVWLLIKEVLRGIIPYRVYHKFHRKKFRLGGF